MRNEDLITLEDLQRHMLLGVWWIICLVLLVRFNGTPYEVTVSKMLLAGTVPIVIIGTQYAFRYDFNLILKRHPASIIKSSDVISECLDGRLMRRTNGRLIIKTKANPDGFEYPCRKRADKSVCQALYDEHGGNADSPDYINEGSRFAIELIKGEHRKDDMLILTELKSEECSG